MKYLILLCSITLFQVSYGQEYAQYFDGDSLTWPSPIEIEIDSSQSNIWQIGPPQKQIFNSAASSPNSLMTDTINNYSVNDSSICTAIITDPWLFEFWGIFAVEWMQKIDFEQDSDFGTLEFSLDEGQSWENAFDSPLVYNFYGFEDENVAINSEGNYAFTGQDTTWKNVWFCIENLYWDLTSDSLMLRFGLESDSVDTANEGWLIDNLLIHQTWIHTVEELKQSDYVQIGPNPTSGRINIRLEKVSQSHFIEGIEIIDMNGRVVHKYGKLPTKTFIDIPSHVINGEYILRIQTNIKSVSKKIVVQR